MSDRVRVFKPEDFELIKPWYEARGLEMPNRKLYPTTGGIVDGVAAGFLLLTDSCLGIIDGYISNPDTRRVDRYEALIGITNHLISQAHVMGCTVVKCDSKIPSIKRLAEFLGASITGEYTSFQKEL